jgi:hypothetical protein
MLKGLKGILEKGLQIAAPMIGGMFGGPGGAALGSGVASLLTGNKVQDAIASAGIGYLGSKAGILPGGGEGKSFTRPSFDFFQRGETKQNQAKPSIFQTVLESFKPVKDDEGKVSGPGMGMQALSALGPGVLAYLAAKQDAAKPGPADPSKYMSSVDTMYGGQYARPPEERRIRNLGVSVDPTTGLATYAQGGIMDIAAMEEISYPVTGLSTGGFPRRTGSIKGPGTATSDSIKAKLSDGEFVQRTAAVNGAGILMGAKNVNEAREKGADFMYALQDKLAKVGDKIT